MFLHSFQLFDASPKEGSVIIMIMTCPLPPQSSPRRRPNQQQIWKFPHKGPRASRGKEPRWPIRRPPRPSRMGCPALPPRPTDAVGRVVCSWSCVIVPVARGHEGRRASCRNAPTTHCRTGRTPMLRRVSPPRTGYGGVGGGPEAEVRRELVEPLVEVGRGASARSRQVRVRWLAPKPMPQPLGGRCAL